MAAEISVVIPTRNRRRLLARTLGTVLAQEHVDIEVVVVDEGSEDGTGAYLAGLGDRRIHVVRHDRPKGVAAARNAGIQRAEADWVAFTDDDDLWAPGKLCAQLAALERSPEAGWSCTGAILIDDQLRVIRPHVLPDVVDVTDLLLVGNVVPGGASSVVARTDLVRRLGGFDTKLANLADWDQWIRLALAAPLAPVDRPLVGYLVHQSGMAHDVGQAERELAVIDAKFSSVRHERGVTLGRAGLLVYFGELHLRAGRRLPAARAHARLLRHHRHELEAALGGWKRSRWAVVAGAGLLWPGVQRAVDRYGGRMSGSWGREAEQWLAPIRAECHMPS
jgi:glycosyltransferase involved in cell wall biosynthesis